MLFLSNDLALPGASHSSYSPHVSAVAPELGRAFSVACDDSSPAATSTLRTATVGLVRRLKSDGLPPERVVIAVKTALVRYGGCYATPSFDEDRAANGRQSKIYRRVFYWALDTYYETE
ncbi:MAG: hypothetical protein JWM41_349 [Gemmatimonadetes bacterium]|nr:hypothetical protein [Gemmatimonadota bacterium]